MTNHRKLYMSISMARITANELHDTLIYEAKKYYNGSPMISK